MRARATLTLTLALLLAALVAGSPASGGSSASARRKRSRPASRAADSLGERRVPPSLSQEEAAAEEQLDDDEADSDTEALVSGSDGEGDDDVSEAQAAAAPPTPPPVATKRKKASKAVATSSKAGAVSKKRRRKKAPPPPPPSMTAWMGESFNKLSEGVAGYVESAKTTLAAQQAARHEAAEQQRKEQERRMRQLRREVGAMQARTARRGRVGDEDDDHDGHDDEDDDEDGRERHVATADGEYYELEEAPLTLSERGAIIGSVLLSPAGMPGLLVGGAFGGAAGYVTERIEQARSYVASAYGDRVETEHRNAAEIAAAHRELKALADVTVRCEDPEEAEQLRQAMVAFLTHPPNTKCADCATKLAHRNEAWASVNLGVLVCVNCAAVHRSMGVAVSRVKSPVFDRWDATSARALLAGGNERARSLYLARLPRGYVEPTSRTDPEKLASFIRTKYVRMRWAEPELREATLGARKAAQEAAAEAQAARDRTQKKRPARKARPASGAQGGPARSRPMPSLSSESL